MAADVEIQVQHAADGATVVVSGEIDRATAGRLRAALDGAAREHGALVIDLTEVTYLDSSGVAVLFDRLRRNGDRIVVGASSLVRPVLELTGLPHST